jgi:hypothetical protein
MQKSDFSDRQFRQPPLTDPVVSLLVAASNATTPSRPTHILHSQDAEGEFYNLILFHRWAERNGDLGFKPSEIVHMWVERPNQFDQLVGVVFDGEPKASDRWISVIEPKHPVRIEAHQRQCNRRGPTERFPIFAYVFEERD